MTNAIAQNIDNSNNEVVLNTIMPAVENQVTAQDVNFSNILNNANTKKENVQTKFIDKAVKTNTSSINKFVLNNNSKTKNIKNYKAKQDYTTDVRINDNKVKKQSVQETTINTDKTVLKTNNDIVNTNNNTQIQQNDNLSDINNSSFVESSPVFSLNEENKNAKTENINQNDISNDLLTDKLLEILTPIAEINLTNEDTNIADKIDEFLSAIENTEELRTVVENISELFDNSDLSQNTKENLNELINTISLKNTDTKAEAKEIINKIFEAISNTKVNTTKDIEEVTISTEKTDIINDVKESLKELNTILEKLNKNNKDTQITNKNDNLLKDIEKVAEKIENKISSDENEIKIDTNEKLTNILNNLKKVVSDKSASNKDNNIEDTNNIQNEENIDLTTNNKDTKIEIKPIETIDIKENLSEIMKENKKQSEDFIKEATRVITNNENETKELTQDKIVSQDTIKEAIASLKEDIKTYLKEEDINSEIKTEEIKPEVQNIDLSNVKEIKTQNNNLDNLIKNNSNIKDTKNIATLNQDFSKEDLELNQQETDLFNDNEITTNTNLTTKNINQIEENLQKAIYTQELMEDMLVSAEVQSNANNSIALTVADEVTRMAMEEGNSTIQSINTQGSIVYDSASGNGSLIKNAASLIQTNKAQTTEFKMSDLFNQIGDKLQQLKDNQGQKLTMVLRPNDLGRLSLELTTNKNGLTTNIMAQNEDVRQYIEKNIDSLRQQLTDAGIKVNNIQIKTVGQADSTNYEGNIGYDNNENQQQETFNNKNQQQNDNRDNTTKQEQESLLANISNYDTHFAKDFSAVLNNAINYNLI